MDDQHPWIAQPKTTLSYAKDYAQFANVTRRGHLRVFIRCPLYADEAVSVLCFGFDVSHCR